MIKIERLKKYISGMSVLDNINMDVKPGEIVSLVGENGAGKTTLVNIIACLAAPSNGDIYLNGEILTSKSLSKIGFVLENPMYLEKLTAKEYFTFVAILHGIEKHELELVVGKILVLTNLYNEPKLIEKYSKGMKAKVSFGAALINNPEYLILDEPFDGLDFSSTTLFIEALRKLSKENGVGILITSHRLDVIMELSDRIIFLKNGLITKNFSIAEIKEKGVAADRSFFQSFF